MRVGRIIAAFCMGSMLAAAAAGGSYPCMAAESETVAENKAEDTESGEDFSFGDLSGKEFVFSSGVGAWATSLEIAADGSFSGTYHDSDMGSSGEGYPNGTCYQCEFSGQFTQPEKVDDNTWSMQICEMTYEKEVGTEEIVDGVRYCFSEAYGLSGAQRILVYLPGAPLDALPESYRSWITMNLSDAETTVLPFYGLYNEGGSMQPMIENLKAAEITKERVYVLLEML